MHLYKSEWAVMIQQIVCMAAVFLGIVLSRPLIADGSYRDLLPRSMPEDDPIDSKHLDRTGQLQHLLHKYQGELKTCAALVNTKRKAYISKLNKVMAMSGSAVFRFRKNEREAPGVQLENLGHMSPLVESCIVGIFKQSDFKDRLHDVAIDGRIVVNFSCDLAVERNIITLDEIDYDCKAKWKFYTMSALYPESILKTWK